MPFYDYECDQCGKTGTRYSSVADRDNQRHCEGCGRTLNRIQFPTPERAVSPGYWKERVSDALGVNPDQIPAAMKIHPGAEFTPDGAMIIRSHAEFTQRLKESGMVDRNR